MIEEGETKLIREREDKEEIFHGTKLQRR